MIIRHLFISAICILGLSTSWGQVTKKALFLGNSYTAYNNLPMLVGALAFSTQDTLVFDTVSPGGFRFSRHAEYSSTLNKIKSEDWGFRELAGK